MEPEKAKGRSGGACLSEIRGAASGGFHDPSRWGAGLNPELASHLAGVVYRVYVECNFDSCTAGCKGRRCTMSYNPDGKKRDIIDDTAKAKLQSVKAEEQECDRSFKAKNPWEFKVFTISMVAIALGGVLLFVLGAIALLVKFVLMLFYPLNDSPVPTQTVAQYWPLSLKLIAWELYLTAALLIAVVCIGGIAVASAFLRKNVANVFLSYHHSNYLQVLDVARGLQKSGINALFVEFMTTPQHDALLDEIYEKIKKADIFICFPGLEPSFVESEVSAAVVQKKPIFIILSQINRGAPNTLQKSYPTLILEQLQMQQFASLFTFVKYLYGDWRNTVKLLCGPIKLFGTWIMKPSWPRFIKVIFFAPFFATFMLVIGLFLLKGIEYSLLVVPFLSFSWSEAVVLLE
jgi:hypothetical protein